MPSGSRASNSLQIERNCVEDPRYLRASSVDRMDRGCARGRGSDKCRRNLDHRVDSVWSSRSEVQASVSLSCVPSTQQVWSESLSRSIRSSRQASNASSRVTAAAELRRSSPFRVSAAKRCTYQLRLFSYRRSASCKSRFVVPFFPLFFFSFLFIFWRLLEN